VIEAARGPILHMGRARWCAKSGRVGLSTRDPVRSPQDRVPPESGAEVLSWVRFTPILVRTEIKNFKVASLVKFTATIGTVNGILLALPIFLLYTTLGATLGAEQGGLAAGMGIGVAVSFGVVLMNAIGGAIIGLVTGLVYNIVSGMSGGIEIELDRKS